VAVLQPRRNVAELRHDSRAHDAPHRHRDRGHGGDGNNSYDSNSTGLGLAIVASITEAHGGTVTARSGGGATEFQIALPAAQ
jgi:signal transduction histidine kinase